MKTNRIIAITVFLMSVMNATLAKASADACNSILSGESPELTAAIRDLSKLRYDLDVGASKGEENAATRALQSAYIKKEAEILRFAKINREELVARIRTEIESLQKESNTQETRRTEVKAEEQKEIQKIKEAERLLKTGTFAKIPAGTFMMGDKVFHQVTLTQDYEMQMTPVTQKQYFAVMGGENPSEFQNKKHCPDTWQEGIGCPENPVENISWNDAQSFIQRLNAEDDGYLYRLPTEAEWENAARVGSSTAYYWGDVMDDDYAWHSKNSGGQTHAVAQKKPNKHGLYDMSGNVWEWVSDWYGDYPDSAVIDPQGPPTGSYRSLRGGGWNDYARSTRSGNRDYGVAGNRGSDFGFRLVRTPRTP